VEGKKLPHRRGEAEVEVTSLDSATIVTVAGDVDFASQDELRIAARWAADRNLPIRIDLTGAAFLDTSGLELISRLAGLELQRRRSLTLVGAPERVKHMLEITGLDDLVTYVDRSSE
jgi:anti-anti-sigma factor